jgi:acyl-ACP thioesterase
MTLTRKIDYYDVDTDLKLKLGSYFKLLQESAVLHSEKVGYGTEALLEQGKVWILNAVAAEIYRYPTLREQVDVVTWHKKSQGFKAYRDFLVVSENERLAAATSLWLYFDTIRKRLVRVPKDTGDIYTTEDESALDYDWKNRISDSPLAPEFQTNLSVRQSDFDPLNHVNNAIYFDYLETMISRAYNGEKRIRRVEIQYKKEIDIHIETVQTAFARTDSGLRFTIFDDHQVFAFGTIAFTEG